MQPLLFVFDLPLIYPHEYLARHHACLHSDSIAHVASVKCKIIFIYE
jgi:hypothetical protein